MVVTLKNAKYLLLPDISIAAFVFVKKHRKETKGRKLEEVILNQKKKIYRDFQKSKKTEVSYSFLLPCCKSS